MRYVGYAIGVLFVVGLLRGIPFAVLVMISIFALLAGAAIVGARSDSRVAALRRAVFLTDTLIGYQETMPEPDTNDDARP